MSDAESRDRELDDFNRRFGDKLAKEMQIIRANGDKNSHSYLKLN